MGGDEGRANRLAEVYVRSAPAGYRLAYPLTGDRRGRRSFGPKDLPHRDA